MNYQEALRIIKNLVSDEYFKPEDSQIFQIFEELESTRLRLYLLQELLVLGYEGNSNLYSEDIYRILHPFFENIRTGNIHIDFYNGMVEVPETFLHGYHIVRRFRAGAIKSANRFLSKPEEEKIELLLSIGEFARNQMFLMAILARITNLVQFLYKIGQRVPELDIRDDVNTQVLLNILEDDVNPGFLFESEESP